MSHNPETDLDLEKLLLPAWAQEPATLNRYAHFEGGDDRPDRPGRGGDRFGRRDRPPRRDGGGPRGPRRDDRPGPRREERGGPRPPRADFNRDDRRDRRPEPPLPLPEVAVTFAPEEHGVESLARQIRVTGRAYPLFEIAQLILQKPERYVVTFQVKKNPEGQPLQPLFSCALDDTLWLAEAEAVGHVLDRHFATFYQAERTATEPPKGTYTFVAQCGMSGIVLGPPNHHDYQNQLRRLHAERFSRMPFEAYKSRVRIVKDEAVVKKWVEDQSFKTEFICLNVPETVRLADRAAVEKHFREVHLPNLIKPVDTCTLNGKAARSLRAQGLTRLVHLVWEDLRRFPLPLATTLSQQFAAHGLQFFKVNRTVTHVSVARPRFLDLETTPVSEGIRRIVDFINAHAKCIRRTLFEALAPTPAPAAPAVPPAGGAAAATAATPPTTAPAAQSAEPTAEQTAIIADLHWLIHQGHVLEFANGVLETAKRPLPKPPKPESKPESKPAPESVPAAEAVAAPTPAEPPTAMPEASAAAAPPAEVTASTTVEPPPVVAAVEPEVVTPPVAEATPAVPTVEPPPAASPAQP